MAYSPAVLKSARARPAASEIQPMGLPGRRDATRAPTSVKSRATARKMKGTFTVPQTPALSTTRVGLLRTRSTADAESSATDNRPSDQASQEAVRRLILPSPRSCSLAPSVITPPYNTTVSKALRQTLRGRGLNNIDPHQRPRAHGAGTEDVEAGTQTCSPASVIMVNTVLT